MRYTSDRITAVASMAQRDPKTVQRFLRGMPVHPETETRFKAAFRELGLDLPPPGLHAASGATRAALRELGRAYEVLSRLETTPEIAEVMRFVCDAQSRVSGAYSRVVSVIAAESGKDEESSRVATPETAEQPSR